MSDYATRINDYAKGKSAATTRTERSEENLLYAQKVADVIHDYALRELNPTQTQREELDRMFLDLRVSLDEVVCS